MLNNSKIQEYFNYEELGAPVIHVIGCGAIGSTVCESLARLDITRVHVYDFDTVQTKNIANQKFTTLDVGRTKVEAVAEMMYNINQDMEITIHEKGLQEPYTIKGGIIILAVDNIDLRREIVKANQYNPNITFIMDFRMRLVDAQFYAGCVQEPESITQLLGTMEFSHEEATEATPMSACGVTLNVCYTVQGIVACGMSNLVSYMLGNKYSKLGIFNLETYNLLTM